MLYPVLNGKSQIPLFKRIQLTNIPILTYADAAAWAPFIYTSQWRRIKAVQTIGLRAISGTPPYVRNEVLISQFRGKTIEKIIRTQSRATFYRNSRSQFPRIRKLRRASFPITILYKRLSLKYKFKYSFNIRI